MDKALKEIQDCINIKQSFKLEAGAGSGKTWSLVESLNYIIRNKGENLLKYNRKITCITYTNAAADEINERIDNNPLVFVGTIHSFLWSIIGRYTQELKNEILDYNNRLDINKQIPNLKDSLEKVKRFEYNLYKRDLSAGQLWHEDIIHFSKILFEKSHKLALLTVNQYPYIFIDEYQDTFPKVISLLLDDIYMRFKDRVIMGFFGDSMQSIYDRGVGYLDISKYQDIKEITKLENFRCSKKVIDLLGFIRPELKQYPAGNNKEGEISFYFGNNNFTQQKLLIELEKKGWNFKNKNETKILYLTHRKIAQQGGYLNLLDAFPNRDRFFDRGYIFSRLFFEIEDICYSYFNEDYANLFTRLRSNEFRLQKHSDKKRVRLYIEELNTYRQNNTIKEMFDFIVSNDIQIFQINDYRDFIKNLNAQEISEEEQLNRNIFENIKNIPFVEVSNAYSYIERNTLYSTKHGVKGREYDNVLVIVDDKAWRNFNDNEVFSKKNRDLSRYNRSRNLLYVCCSRSKNNLVLFAITEMSSEAKNTIIEWFGKENVK